MADYIKQNTWLTNMIRDLREVRGLTRAELAELVGISESHVSKIENGIKRPSIDTFGKILMVFEADIEIRLAPGSVHDQCLDKIKYIMKKHGEGEVIALTNIFEAASKEIGRL